MYAIVDIETTGGRSNTDRITEVAIITITNGEVVDRYETLINPGVRIPATITRLTGIDDALVEDAPSFSEVAAEIHKRTADAIFVAHNVNFDYGFLKEHFSEVGMTWKPRRLCTVRLSRKIMPGMYSYSLGKLAQQLGYIIEHRHRAMGDCDFTAELFLKLQEKDKDGHIQFALNARSREATLPPLLDRKVFLQVPESRGVYIMKGSKGRVLYVGKATNLKKRLSEHFRRNTHTGYKNRFIEQIEDLEYIVSPNELISLLTEAQLIKKHWPPFNRSLKRISLNWGVFAYSDQNGYGRFNYGRVGKWDKPILSFKSQHEVRLVLDSICKEFDLCARYCGLQDGDERCDDWFGQCYGACVLDEPPAEYNKRYQLANTKLSEFEHSLIIKGKGFTEKESSVILIENGRFKGHGTIESNASLTIDSVKESIETAYDDQDLQSIIRSFIFQIHSGNTKEEFEVVSI